MEQFDDFYAFNKAINKYGMQSGIVKIIPPSAWIAQTAGCYTEENMNAIKIKNPIVQNVNTCGSGVYTVQNVEKQRSYNIHQWKRLSEQPNNAPPTNRGAKASASPAAPAPDRCSSSPLSPIIGLGSARSFSPDQCDLLEKNYWRSITYAEPMYGADVLGSLFTQSIKTWNVASLPNVLDYMEQKVPGVNDAYLYAGLWKALFAWHLEDQDLHSINYIHFGAPKQWYLIPQCEHERFFALMKETFDDEFKQCSQFLRHKTFMVSPQFLAKHGITCNKIVHNANEFIITYPYGYHAGFNYGFNLAESVNFALDDWFPIGEVAQKCECVQFSVGIDVRRLKQRYLGIKDEDIDHEPALQTHKEQNDKKGHNKRQRHDNVKLEPGQDQKRLIQKRHKLAVYETAAVTPRECLLCPNVLSEKAKRRREFSLLSCTFKGRPASVHRLCASMFPGQLEADDDNNTVKGLELISAAQRNLRCGVCRRNRTVDPARPANPVESGACFQCDHPKCVRLYHATCGVVDAVDIRATEGKATCKYHRTPPQLPLPVAREEMVQFVVRGQNACGIVVSDNQSEQTVLVTLYPEFTELMEIPYEWLIWT